MYLFLQYPKCSTCQKAKKWLEANHVEFVSRHIVEENPKATELSKWIAASGQPVKKFFNTSGNKYKELALKEKTADHERSRANRAVGQRRDAGETAVVNQQRCGADRL